MPLVDDRGRLFGRFNLLDAIVAVVLLGFIPLVYGMYLLFRTPAPRLVGIEPATLVKGPNLRVSVRGEHLRPYMRVSFGSVQGNTFIFRNTGEAIVDLNDMPPGVYDIVLYDNAQERSRLANAFTLLPTPLPASQVLLVGTLGNLTHEKAAQITPGLSLASVGEITHVGKPLPESTRVFSGGVVLEIPVDRAVRVPVAIRAGCLVRAPQGLPQCAIGDAALQPTSVILVTTPAGTLPLQIDQIRSLQPVEKVQLTVQFTTRTDVARLIAPGDADYGPYLNELAAGARVTAKAPPVAVGSDLVRVDVTMQADVQRGSSSWVYAAAPVRVGTSIPFRTPRYELQGMVVGIDPAWPGGSAPSPTQ
jgi:hypothetical protein